MMTNYLLFIIFGYLLGSIPWGFLVCKLRRIDIRQVGSGAIGGTNVSRALGIKFGALVSILDILKAAVPVCLATKFLFFDWQIALVALSPILGHIFPIWLRFKGGKGVASTFGVLFVLLGWRGILILILIQVLALIIFRIMSFASLTMASFIPLLAIFISNSLSFYILGIVLAVLIWWAHRENLQRIIKGVEPKFKLSKSI